MQRWHLCRQLATQLHHCQRVRNHTISLLQSPVRQAPAPAWAIRRRDSWWLRRHCRIGLLPLHRAMTAAELREVPQLDRNHFTSTLHLKALRLDASQCQQYMKALQGCGFAIFVDLLSVRTGPNLPHNDMPLHKDMTRTAGTSCTGHASRLSCVMKLTPRNGCCCCTRTSVVLVSTPVLSG
jgi:hypothetical protein